MKQKYSLIYHFCLFQLINFSVNKKLYTVVKQRKIRFKSNKKQDKIILNTEIHILILNNSICDVGGVF